MFDPEQMRCQVFTEHDNLVTMEEMTSGYTIRVNINLDFEDFGSHAMNKFALYKSLAKHL